MGLSVSACMVICMYLLVKVSVDVCVLGGGGGGEDVDLFYAFRIATLSMLIISYFTKHHKTRLNC